MSDRQRTYVGIAILALVAFLIVALPSGGRLTDFVNATISAIFYAVIGISIARWYKSRPLWLTAMPDRDRALFFGAGSVALLARVADERFASIGSGGRAIEWTIIGLCALTAFLVWRQAQRNAF